MMEVIRQRARFIPSLNSYFVKNFDQKVVDVIKMSREDHLGGDKFLGKDGWEISEEVWSRIKHFPHTFIDRGVSKPAPLVLEINENDPKGKYHYQDIAAEELRKRENALLFFDTGTGKTRTTLLALSALTEDMGACIVVGEANLSKVWFSQVQEHFPQFAHRFVILNDGKGIPERIKKVKNSPEGTIFIVNIESLRNKAFVEAINSTMPAVVVCDECQCMIGKTAQQTQGMHSVQSDFRWALSATPIKNSPLEWHSLLAWLRVLPLEGMFTRFKEYYAYATVDRFGRWNYTTFRNEEDLEDLKNLVTLRVEKAGLNLPERHIIPTFLESDEELDRIKARIDREKRKEWVDFDISFKLGGTPTLYKLIQTDNVSGLFYIERVATAIAKEKIDFVMKQKEEQMIVVSCLKFPLEYIHSLMPEESVLYHGDIPAQVRELYLEQFKRGEKRVLLMTRKSGGVGLTLVNSHIMIFLDAPENMANFNQCADRVHRIGQIKEVQIFIPKIEGSLDEYAWEHIDEKQSWIERYYEVNYEEKG